MAYLVDVVYLEKYLWRKEAMPYNSSDSIQQEW
jgi:hypothetical protein